jgi:hypothetical protein
MAFRSFVPLMVNAVSNKFQQYWNFIFVLLSLAHLFFIISVVFLDIALGGNLLVLGHVLIQILSFCVCVCLSFLILVQRNLHSQYLGLKP